MRQEVIEEKFSEILGRLTFDDKVLAWVREAVHARAFVCVALA